MERQFRHLSEVELIALYLFVKTAKSGGSEAILTNSFLQSYFDVAKVYEKRINFLRKTFEHLFQDFTCECDHYNRRIVRLKLSEGGSEKRPIYISEVPSIENMEKYLGISAYTLSINRS